MEFVIVTKNISIVVQCITSLISFQGVFLTLPKEHMILNDLLKLESFVQLIELVFYIFILRFTAIEHMASIRYFDWFITTPIMLFTTMVYFRYRNLNSEGMTITIEQFLNQYGHDVIKICILNFLMLFFGYLGEVNKLDMITANVIGTIFFTWAFGLLYSYTHKDTQYKKTVRANQKFFFFMFIVWGLYGVAAFTNDVIKNNMFNILDILAKNFFGLFLYYQAVEVKISK